MPSTTTVPKSSARFGPLFMSGIPGTHIDRKTESLIRDHALGGVILFSRNIESPVQVARLCRDLHQCATSYRGVPLFLAIDQEGGRVSRLKAPFTQFPGNVAIGQGQQPTDRAKEFGQVTAKEMRLVGLNMDMAPVMDVRRGTVEKHLRGRTFSDDPRLVAELGVAVIKALQSNGIIAVAKHFPGLGRARLDPHLELPTITASREEMDQVNLPPFGAAIGARVSAIMTSHAIYTDLDPDKPATLSKEIITDLLRKKMGYEGIVITDDLEMGAIRKNWGVAESAVKSFAAGCDILLICQDQENVRKGLMAFERELDCGGIPEERLTESLGRITRLKSGFLRPLQPISIDAVREYFPDPMPITV